MGQVQVIMLCEIVRIWDKFVPKLYKFVRIWDRFVRIWDEFVRIWDNLFGNGMNFFGLETNLFGEHGIIFFGYGIKMFSLYFHGNASLFQTECIYRPIGKCVPSHSEVSISY